MDLTMTTRCAALLLPILFQCSMSATAQELPNGLKEVESSNGVTLYANEAAMKLEVERRARVAARTADKSRWLDFTDEDDLITRIDRRSIQVNGMRVRAQFRSDYYIRNPLRPDIAYSVVEKEYDCAASTRQDLWGTGYDEEGNVVITDDQPRAPVAWVPGTRGELYHRMMCALREDVAKARDPAGAGR